MLTTLREEKPVSGNRWERTAIRQPYTGMMRQEMLWKKGVEVRQSVHWKNHPGPSPSERLMIRRTVLSESRTEPAQKYVTPMTS